MTRISGRRRNLAAREFDPVMWGQFLDLAAQIARKQVVSFDSQYPGDHEHFQIRHPARLVFQPRHRFPAGVPAKELQFQGKLILRPPFALAHFAHLRADDI